MSINWLDSFTLTLLVIFLAEVLVARHIYRKIRRKNQEPQKEIIIVFNGTEAKTQLIQSHESGQLHSPTPYQINEFYNSLQSPPQIHTMWTTISLATCVSAVFLISFILLNWVQSPLVFSWSLRLLTVLVPLPFLTFPSLFQLRSFSTFSILFLGLGCGLLLSVLV